MQSKERMRNAILHKPVDRIPAAFEAVPSVEQKLMKHYGFQEKIQLWDHFQADVIPVEPKYIGPPLKEYLDAKGNLVKQSYWGWEDTMNGDRAGQNSYFTSYYPLEGMETVEEIENYSWPDPDWFDYDAARIQCEKNADRATIAGHEGPFHMALFLRPMEDFLVDMLAEPEIAEKILEKIHDFEMEYYKRLFEACGGMLDILRPHDDYGTQRGLLFSRELWNKYMRKNTTELADLAHRYGGFYQQHSCGAINDIIPDLIDCGVDILEPIQKVVGMEPEHLKADYGKNLTFHGGIDTQGVLPFGTPEEVSKETRKFLDILGGDGTGYILMGSQSLEDDVPIANIEAMYREDRHIR